MDGSIWYIRWVFFVKKNRDITKRLLCSKHCENPVKRIKQPPVPFINLYQMWWPYKNILETVEKNIIYIWRPWHFGTRISVYQHLSLICIHKKFKKNRIGNKTVLVSTNDKNENFIINWQTKCRLMSTL